MNTGDLTERVTFQVMAMVDDGYGGTTTEWTNIATNPEVWARVAPLNGRERIEAQQISTATNYRVSIRNRADITAAMRLSWRGQAMNIRAVNYAGPRASWLVLDCEVI